MRNIIYSALSSFLSFTRIHERNIQPGKQYWRVTFRSGQALTFILLGEDELDVRIFRTRVAARTAAWVWRKVGRADQKQTSIEPFTIGATLRGGLQESPEALAQRYIQELRELVEQGEIDERLAARIWKDVFLVQDSGALTIRPNIYRIHRESMTSQHQRLSLTKGARFD